MAPELMTPEDAAKMLHRTPATLQWWRTTDRGPKYVKIGRAVLYRALDLNEFIIAGERTPAKA